MFYIFQLARAHNAQASPDESSIATPADCCSSAFISASLPHFSFIFHHLCSYFVPLFFILANYSHLNACFWIDIPKLLVQNVVLKISVPSHLSMLFQSLLFAGHIHRSFFSPTPFSHENPGLYHTILLLPSPTRVSPSNCHIINQSKLIQYSDWKTEESGFDSR